MKRGFNSGTKWPHKLRSEDINCLLLRLRDARRQPRQPRQPRRGRQRRHESVGSHKHATLDPLRHGLVTRHGLSHQC